MNTKLLATFFVLGFLLSSCQIFLSPPTPIPSPTPQPTLDLVTPSPFPMETPLPLIEPITPTRTRTPEMTPTQKLKPDLIEELPEEVIMILEPAPGSRVTSPVRVSGYADPTFEQNLLMRILLEDGTELPVDFTMIQADLGERGYFEFEYHFVRSGQGFIQVYDVSARDGGITHLSSVGVLLDPTGTPEIETRDSYLERIAIFNPANSDVVSGGVVTVEGIGIASFEQILVIDVLDGDGNLVGSDFVTLTSDLGEYGEFRIELTYSISAPQPGRVVVRDPSPAHGGNNHLSSVEIMLEP